MNIEAITVSLGFEGMDFSPIQKFCDELGVHYSIVDTQIGEIIFDAERKKILVPYAQKCEKVL